MTQNNPSKWTVDPGHSQLQFKVRHLAISNIVGGFKVFSGEVLSETADFDGAKVRCVINAASIDTNNAQRDEHLKSELFLDVQQFPEIVFAGALNKKNDNYELAGDLTIHGTTHNVTLEGTFTGTGIGRFGPQTRAGFEVTGKISRKDFGITWNMLTEAGGIIMGDEIKLNLDIQLIGQ